MSHIKLIFAPKTRVPVYKGGRYFTISRKSLEFYAFYLLVWILFLMLMLLKMIITIYPISTENPQNLLLFELVGA